MVDRDFIDDVSPDDPADEAAPDPISRPTLRIEGAHLNTRCCGPRADELSSQRQGDGEWGNTEKTDLKISLVSADSSTTEVAAECRTTTEIIREDLLAGRIVEFPPADPAIPTGATEQMPGDANWQSTRKLSAGTAPTTDRPATDDTGRSRLFLFGPENAALGSAIPSTQKPAYYNPILLYGPTGIGKTHLLRSIVESYQREHPDHVTQYVTASDFSRAMTTAKELDTVDDFREKYRSCQLLAIDDLQELTGRPAAQIELSATLDELVRAGNQLYLASRRTLAEFDTLLPGLKSRLMGGLSLPIVKPSAEARRAIIFQLARQRELILTEDVLSTLAAPHKKYSHLLESVPQLAGVLTELSAASDPTIGMDQLRGVLDLSTANDAISARKITTKAAHYFRLKTADLTGPSRKHAVVVARGVAIYLMRKLSRNSLESIGQQLGRRDHSTILHAYRKTEKAIPTDPVVRESINEIAAQLGAYSPLE